MTGKLRSVNLSIFIFVVSTAVGCGGGGGSDSKVVHSKEDRLKYISEMEAMEGATETIMQESSQKQAAK